MAANWGGLLLDYYRCVLSLSASRSSLSGKVWPPCVQVPANWLLSPLRSPWNDPPIWLKFNLTVGGSKEARRGRDAVDSLVSCPSPRARRLRHWRRFDLRPRGTLRSACKVPCQAPCMGPDRLIVAGRHQFRDFVRCGRPLQCQREVEAAPLPRAGHLLAGRVEPCPRKTHRAPIPRSRPDNHKRIWSLECRRGAHQCCPR